MSRDENASSAAVNTSRTAKRALDEIIATVRHHDPTLTPKRLLSLLGSMTRDDVDRTVVARALQAPRGIRRIEELVGAGVLSAAKLERTVRSLAQSKHLWAKGVDELAGRSRLVEWAGMLRLAEEGVTEAFTGRPDGNDRLHRHGPRTDAERRRSANQRKKEVGYVQVTIWLSPAAQAALATIDRHAGGRLTREEIFEIALLNQADVSSKAAR